jgi:hypothetical protein
MLSSQEQTLKTAGGFAFAQELEKLRPTFEGLRTNAIALAQVFGEFAKVALSVGSALLQIAGNPIVGFMAKIYAIMVPLNMALGVMRGLWALNSLQLLLFNARVAMGVPTLSAFRGMMKATGATAAVTATSIRTAGLTLRTFFASTGVGLVLVGIGLLIERFMSMNQALADTKAKALGAAEAIRSLSKTEAILEGRKQRQVVADLRTLQGSKDYLRKGRETVVRVPEAMAKRLEAQGIPLSREMGVLGGASVIPQNMLESYVQKHSGLQGEAENVPRALAHAERQAQQPADIDPITGADGDAGAAKTKKERESRIPQLTLELEKTKELSAIEMQIVNAQLADNTAQLSALELAKQLVNFKYEEKELELQKLTIGEQSIAKKEIGIRREQAILASQLQLQIDFRKEREAVQEGFVDILAGYDEEFEYQQMYLNLINQGVRPSLAKARVEVEETFKAQEKTLDKLIDQNKANIAGLEVDIARFKLKKELSPIEKQQLDDAEARLKAAKDELAVRTGMKAVVPETKAAAMQKAEQGLAPKTASEYIGEGEEAARDKLEELMNTGYQVVQAANAIGDAFGEAFKGVITGSMTAQEALAGMFRSIADHFADMVAQMIAEYLKMQAIGLLKTIFGAVAGGLGSGLSAGGLPGSTLEGGFANPALDAYIGAKGGVAPGGWQPFPVAAFANGGMVTGPTLGLVGEGRYNEAIIPLPDGKSVPVQLSGGAGGNAAPISTSIVVNVKNGQAESQMSGNQGNQLARELEGAVRQVILKESRPGGLISSSR